MTRPRLSAAPFAPVAALLLAACASGEPPRAPAASVAAAAPPQPESASRLEGAPRQEVDDEIAALAAAEAELDRAVGRSSRRAPAGKADDEPSSAHREEAKDKAGPPHAARPAKKAGEGPTFDRSDTLSAGDPCVTACSALASMERAAKHLCSLTGEGDARCDGAKARVSGATERVSASCPACER